MFFTMSSAATSKPGRPKKGRTSKASRLSTISNFTAVSEGQDVAESQENDGNTTLMSPAGSVISTKTGKGSKNDGKAKKSTAKPKIKLVSTAAGEPTQASSFIEPEDDDFEVKVESSNKKSKRSRKRNSDEMSADTERAAIKAQRVETVDPQPPPAKRRATRTRSSVAQSTLAPVLAQESQDDDAHMTTESMPPPSAPASKKGAKGSRKRASSALRKASATSTASMASLRATIPNDEDLDAALEAGLDRPLTDDENEAEQLEVVHPKTRRLTRTKPGSRNATASVAPVRWTTGTSTMTASDAATVEGVLPCSSLLEPDSTAGGTPQLGLYAEEAASALLVKAKATKGKNTRKASAKQPTIRDTNATQDEHIIGELTIREDEASVKEKPSRSRQPSRQLPQRHTRASDLAPALENVNISPSVNNSMLESFTAEDDSGHETDRSVANQARVNGGRKKGSVAATKSRGGKKAPLTSRKIEDIIQPIAGDTVTVEERETAMEANYPQPAESKVTESESIEEDTKPKKKSAKSTKVKANKPALEKAEVPQPSKPRSESSKHQSLEHQSPATQLADGKTDTNSFNPAQSAREATCSPTQIIVSSPAPLPSAQTTPKQTSPRQSSDAENEPPSSRPSRLRPPLTIVSPSKSQTIRVPLAASTPVTSPSKQKASKLQSSFPWTAIDFEKFFSTGEGDKENDASVLKPVVDGLARGLASPEKEMTVEQWILFNAKKSEEKLRGECERLVGKFEGEGVRALKTLEGIACGD